MEDQYIAVIESSDDLEEIFEEAKRALPPSLKKKIRKPSVRHEMKEKCGSKAFLMPDKEKFPVMNPDTCKYDCRLLLAAYTRARQWAGKKPHYREIANKAKELMKKNNCGSKIGVHVEDVGVVPLEKFLDAVLMMEED